jgi:hypothetical protein
MTISKKAAKEKGKRLQKWTASKISEFLNIPFGNEDENIIKSRPMGLNGTDVILIGDAKKKFPFSIECKSAESFSLTKTIEQVKKNTKVNESWLIIYKNKKLTKPVAIVDAELLIQLIAEKYNV